MKKPGRKANGESKAAAAAESGSAVRRLVRSTRKWAARAAGAIVLAAVCAVALPAFVNPPSTARIAGEYFRLGEVRQDWVALEAVPDHLPSLIAAAEDAAFCRHWGFDLDSALSGAGDGTISQQVARGLYLWQSDGGLRRALEIPATWAIEIAWSKRRIMEIYLNTAKFDRGVFGAAEGARNYFGVEPGALTPKQSALLAVVLASPEDLDAGDPGAALNGRAERLLGVEAAAGGAWSGCFNA